MAKAQIPTRTRYGYCHTCPKTKLKRLKTCDGDPEGIRADQKCPKCGAIYGCTKACQSVLTPGPKERRKRNKKWRNEALLGLKTKLVGKKKSDQFGNPIFAPRFSKVLEKARRNLDWETMNVRGRDGLDFHDVGVCRMRDIVQMAYELGMADSYDSLMRMRARGLL